MSRLAPLDKALVLILVPIWVVCFALGVRTQVRGVAGHAALGLSVEDADSYPTLTPAPRVAVESQGMGLLAARCTGVFYCHLTSS